MPLRYDDSPTVGSFPGEAGRVHYREGPLVGYRWYDARRMEVAYPFGHGLSYTTFAYADIAATIVDDGPEPLVEVSATVTNTGVRAGQEVVQLYVSDVESGVHRPPSELKAFAKVPLEPGERGRVLFRLGRRAFAFWHPGPRRWVVEPGRFDLRIGGSSRDLPLVTGIELTGEILPAELGPESPMGDWLDHPVGGPLMRAALRTHLESLENSEAAALRLFRQMPVARLIRLPGFPVTARDLNEWLETLAG